MWSRLALVFLTLAPAALAQSPLTLWYKQPANLWRKVRRREASR